MTSSNALQASTSQQSNNSTKKLTIIHFNDAYHVEPFNTEPVGGAARLTTLFKRYADENPLILFSGDIFNPSLMSTVTKGKHMVPILNAMGVQYSVMGNHDFDFGVAELEKLLSQCKSKWLLSNVFDKTTDKPLANGLVSDVFTWNGIKIGIIGLVEEDWIVTLSFDVSNLKCLDFISEGRRLARHLKEQQGAEIVIALTHMRLPNDEKLAMEVPEIDIILGGHDHFYEVKTVCDIPILKSGSEFRNATLARITLPSAAATATATAAKQQQPPPRCSFELKRLDVTSAEYEEDPEVKQIIDHYAEIMKHKLDNVIGFTDEVLDARSFTVRTREGNLGNFVTDVMRMETGSDIALLNSGTIRSDSLYGPGPLTLGDLLNIFPFEDIVIVISITGQQLLSALENGVSKLPAQEGRYLQVSGLKFVVDLNKAPGSRVSQVYVLRKASQSSSSSSNNNQWEPLDLNRVYTCATKEYVAEGKDGFDALKGSPYVVDQENGVLLSTMIRLHLTKLRVISQLEDNTPRSLASAAAQRWTEVMHKRRQQQQPQQPQKKPRRHEEQQPTARQDNSIGDSTPHPHDDDVHTNSFLAKMARRGLAFVNPKVDGRVRIILPQEQQQQQQQQQ